MRVFVKLRQILAANQDLAEKLRILEAKVGRHDKEIKVIFEAIRQLMIPPSGPKKKIGVHAR